MRGQRRWLALFGILFLASPILFLATVPSTCYATWPSTATSAVAICIANGAQEAPVIVSDGSGGAIIAWTDSRTGVQDIYAQHVLANGNIAPGWGGNGNPICTAAGAQTNPVITTDGAGGAILAWQDARTGVSHVFAQRINGSGVVQWTANGVQLCTNAAAEGPPAIVSDALGGAIVAWEDSRQGAGNTDVYAQRILSGGTLAGPFWPGAGALGIFTGAGSSGQPAMVSDGFGGAIIAIFGSDAKRVTVSGSASAGWPALGAPDGVNVFAGSQADMAPDGAGGVVFAGTSGSQVGEAAINGSGVPTWSTGFNIGTGTSNLRCVGDGAGGVVIGFYESSFSGTGLRATRIVAGGSWAPGWETFAGLPLGNLGSGGSNYRMVSDGSGSAVFVSDGSSSGTDIYAQHWTAIGALYPGYTRPPGELKYPAPGWNELGNPVAIAPFSQLYPAVASDGNGGAIVAWQDERNGSGTADIYAQRIERYGQVGLPEPKIASVRDVRGDQGGHVLLRWTPSYLDQEPLLRIQSYSLWRQVPGTAAQAALRRGAMLLRADERAPATAARIVRAEPAAAQVIYWEWLGDVAASADSAYSQVVPTTSDSTTGGNPFTLFRVEAQDRYTEAFWRSPADSGYSVDNLAPATPSPFTGEYAAGTTSLHWGVNAEADFSRYLLYRGVTSDFVPGPGNQVVEKPDTGYVDNAGSSYYYKLAAVDVHGNVSGYALLLPSGTTGVPGPSPGVVEMSPPWPNPARDQVSFLVTLPRTAPVSMSVLDAAGRLVRRVADGSLGPGPHVVAWDLRDAGDRDVQSGLYFMRLESLGTRRIRQFVVTR